MFEHDIEELQKKQLLLGEGKEEVSNIWKELCDRCPLIDKPSDDTTKTKKEQQFVFSEHLKDNSNPAYDICVAYSPNGADTARYSLEISNIHQGNPERNEEPRVELLFIPS